MQFRTQTPVFKSNSGLEYDSKIVSLGSCFAVNIAEQLAYFKFQSSVNPFGILFHPLAILGIIQRALKQKCFTEADLFFHNELWHCFEVHSEMSHPNKAILLQNLNSKLLETQQQISEASHVILTYGTSWVYRHKASQKIVANCHKVPQNDFEKALLTTTQIQEAIQETLALIQAVNTTANIIFTISPVRHLKDGFVENQVSKAHLISAVYTIVNSNTTNLSYFPSYEIQMDELRDYRFYAEDLLHPGTTAIAYIWERFVAAWVSETAIPIMQEVQQIQKGLQHRPFQPNSESHQYFLKQLHHKIAVLQEQYPSIAF